MGSVDVTHLRTDAEILDAIRSQPKSQGTGIMFGLCHCKSREDFINLYDAAKDIAGPHADIFYRGMTVYIHW